MPLKRIQLKPGIDRESTRYSTEGGWYDCDKIRFRSGYPEKIGGWQRFSTATFLGVCRSLWDWSTLTGANLIGVGTSKKFYVERGGVYYDITPVRSSVSLTDPFDTTDTETTVLVTDVAHGCLTGDFVTFSGATAVGGLTLTGEYEVTVLTSDTYTVEAPSAASATANGGGTVTAAYQINIGGELGTPFTGWSAGPFGLGTWGVGGTSNLPLRLWSQTNFGEDLIFNYRNGPIFLWDASDGVGVRATYLSDEVGASDVPDLCLHSFVSDVSRFVFAFGCTPLTGGDLDPMLIRWSDQEDATDWTPSPLNQAGDLRLSHGTEIVVAQHSRQEILVWTDTALYGMQYLGAPVVWGAQLLGDNLSIAGPNATAFATGVTYWMGRDKFYRYDGTVAPLPCSVRRYVFRDINQDQYSQVFAGTNEGFSEIWWFYCSANSTAIDRYVVYNYIENLWYYGTMARTAWIDSSFQGTPIAATYSNNLVTHEVGNDCNQTGTTFPINAYISSSEFDLDDGDDFMFIRRVLPDVTFIGSDADSPTMALTFYPMKNSGSGVSNPASVGGTDVATVVSGTTVDVEEFTGQAFVRLRGRQLIIKAQSTALGVAWQLGAPRLDIRPDGKR
jgi:hypothetical protein